MGMGVHLEEASTSGDEGGDGAESVVAEINITPLTDVFLVLLIIFMVTSTAMVDAEVSSKSGMKVVLPKANAAGAVSKKRTDPVLTVTANGDTFVLNAKVPADKLEAELRKALADAGSDTVLLRVDTSVKTGATVDYMSIAKKAGATHIAILTAKGDGQ